MGTVYINILVKNMFKKYTFKSFIYHLILLMHTSFVQQVPFKETAAVD